MKRTADIRALLLDSFEQSGEAVFLTTCDGIIAYVNPAFETLTGYSREELIGKKPSVLKSGRHPEAFYKEMWDTLLSGQRWTGRLTNKRKDGAYYTEEVRISPVKSGGKVTHFLALRHDIAREMQLEEQLAQAQKMESLGLLAGQLSHDFNNLLTVVIGSMELVMEELQPGSVGHRLSTEIMRSSRESAALIRQLMMFARKHDAKPVETTLNAPLEEMKLLLGGPLGKKIKVSWELAPDLPRVRLEPEHFKQAVMNLAVNARDAMNGEGRITLRTFAAGPGGLPPSLPHGAFAAFELSDSGPGIPPENLQRIFEPFFTTKPKGKGTGLGLSTVYGVVKQNGGHVFASNLPGGGAAFTMYFPVVK